MKKINRRNFIKGAAILSGAVLYEATALKKASAEVTNPNLNEIPALPWPYKEIDPEYVRKLGHLGYYNEECGGGAFWAIMTALKEKVGFPFTTIPLPTVQDFIDNVKLPKKQKKHFQVPMQYGVGGVANFGSLCGAPNGAAAAITYIVPFEEAKKIIPRLLRYYETANFPTDQSNIYASNHKFLVPKYKSDKVLPQSPSESVLCHVSVGKWCEHSGYASGSKERSERCGRLTGDIAAMAIEMVNAYYKGKLEEIYPMKLSHETTGCRSCHSKGKAYETGQFTRGFMECKSCHGDDMTPHKKGNKLKTAFGTGIEKWAGAAAVGTVAGIGAHSIGKRINKEDKNED